MPEKPQSQSLAILIDADNTSARHAHAIFEEIVKLGRSQCAAHLRRFTYGIGLGEKRTSAERPEC